MRIFSNIIISNTDSIAAMPYFIYTNIKPLPWSQSPESAGGLVYVRKSDALWRMGGLQAMSINQSINY